MQLCTRLQHPSALTVLFAIVLSSGCGRATIWANEYADVSGSVGAGFAGMSTAEVTEYPAYEMKPSCPTCTDKLITFIPDSVDLIVSKRHVYRPALSSGIVLHYFPNASLKKNPDAFSLGIGAHMAFLPDAAGKTSPFPAGTIHIGNRSNEFFFGFLFTSNDEVRFPAPLNSSGGFRVRRESPPTFAISSSGHFYKNFYVGIQLNGQRQSEAQAQEAAGETAVSIDVLPVDPTITVGDSVQLTIDVYDTNHRVIRGLSVVVSSSDPAIAAVGTDWKVRAGSKAGVATITARSRGGTVVGTTRVTVRDKP
jgi:hypothetical protein